MKKKRVNVILDENIHKESVRLAKSFGYDFSSFVNLMLETLLNPVDIEGQEQLLTEMFVKELTSRGFTVTKGALQLKGKKIQRQYVKKKG
jgi:antitoxin component of RelBE/YafQ-DinJ toxin-antitoxin module